MGGFKCSIFHINHDYIILFISEHAHCHHCLIVSFMKHTRVILIFVDSLVLVLCLSLCQEYNYKILTWLIWASG